ncbi:hypothetical protein F4781DRAFT_429501 [Annulohypoxylon bovei var. microspora]|nr:hypothetical protein F4781DRAFT_429501 [Annulohypoxylon bovei var. microspora]
MEPPAKRMRLGQAPYDDDDEDEANLDELSMDPNQFDARQDPLYELDKGRAKAATRLKSAFERIFEKYERDFTDVGDEIDLETGEVIINNGHLLSLKDEKDRSREGSISSNEEERIMRGKDVSSVEVSHTKPLSQTTSFTHTPPLGLPAITGQQIMAHHQFSSLGIPPNPYGFMDPFMGHGSADPLWQTPELPIPLYQDRFGFIGQAMGYPPSFGYGYNSMMAPGGGFGHGSFGDVFRPQVPKRLPPAKTPARQLLPRVATDTDNSEEDDLLLGSNTEEVVKSVSIKSIKALPTTVVAEKIKQVEQKGAKSVASAGKEKDAQKPRRGRPRKVAIPANPPESNGKANKKRGRSIETTPSAEISNLAESTNTPVVVPIPSPPPSPSPSSEEEPSLERKDVTETVIAETKASTEEDTESLSTRHRRSSRGRKKTEFYGQITWTKLRQSKPGATDTQNVIEDLPDEASNSLALDINRSLKDVRSEESPHKDITELELSEQPEEVGKKDLDSETHIATLNQEYHGEELPVNSGDTEDGERIQSTPISPQPTIENSEQPDPLFSIITSNTNEVEVSPEDKEMLPCNKIGKLDVISNEELPVHPPEDSAQGTHSNQLDVQEVNSEDRTTEDASITATVEITLPSPVDEETTVDIEETLIPDVIPDVIRETPQSPTTQIQLEEAAVQLPDPVQEDLLLEPEITEPDTAEPESTEPEMPFDNTASQPSFIEDSDPLSLPDEDEPMLPPARLPVIPYKSKIPALFEKAELAFRPQVTQKDPRSRILKSKSPDIAITSSPPKPRSSLTAKPTAATPVPSTPKKRRDSRPEANPRFSSHRTSSPKKKYALTSLVPDDPDEDDDELSVLASSVAPSPFFSHVRSSSKPHSRFNPPLTATPRKPSRRHGFLTDVMRTPHRVSKRGAPPATDSRASRGPKLRFGGGVQSSPLARTVLNLNHRESLAATPSRRGRNRGRDRDRDGDDAGSVELGSSPVRTPGGTARRCGEDGFVCERDFCFTCCK